MLRTRVDEASDQGASAVEYGLIVVAVAALIATVVFFLGTQIVKTYGDTCANLDAEAPLPAGSSCATS